MIELKYNNNKKSVRSLVTNDYYSMRTHSANQCVPVVLEDSFK